MDNLVLRSLFGWVKFIGGTGLLFFIPAGTLAVPQAWACLDIVGAATAALLFYLWRYDRPLLARRLDVGIRAEPEPSQKRILMIASPVFAGIVLIPALDFRWGWSHVPLGVLAFGDILLLIGFWLLFVTFRTNSFAGSTIAIAEDHQVISTGPYGFVRHPMYAGLLLAMTGIVPALGSWWGLLDIIPTAALLIWRLRDEEKILARRLPGYPDYCRKVRSRLIPFVW